MQRSLTTSFGALQWVVNGYMLTLASLILFGGSAGDRWAPSHLVIGLRTFAGLACLRTGAIRIVAGCRPSRSGRGRRPARLPPAWQSSARPLAAGARGSLSARGPRRARSRQRSGLRSAVGWWIRLAGARSSSSICRSPRQPAVRAQASSGSRNQPIGTAGSRWRLARSPVSRIAELRLDRARGRRAARGAVALIARSGDLDFIRREARTRSPMMPPSLFRDRNFSEANAPLRSCSTPR